MLLAYLDLCGLEVEGCTTVKDLQLRQWLPNRNIVLWEAGRVLTSKSEVATSGKYLRVT